MTKFNSENPDPRNRFKPEEQGLNLDDMLNFIEEIKKHGFNATNPKAQEILKKFPYKLQEYLIEIEKIKKDKEKENPNETLAEKEKRKKENSERSNKIAQELFIIACASEMPLDKALQFHENCGFGVKELSQFGENGLSPLSAMMLSDKSPEEMQKVIDKGADINEKSPSGMTVTDLAVLVGNEKMVETLEQKGGKLNLVSKEIGRETEAEEEREKGREKSREREQEKQQRQIQKKQETAQREQAARELKQQMAEERIQQQQIARQMQMVIVREAMEVHEERRAELLKKKKELQKIKEESDAKLREQEEQLKVQNAEIFKEQQFKNEEKKIEKPPISELEKMLGTTLVDLNIDKLLFHAVRNGQQTRALLLVRFGGNVNHRENSISVLDAAVANGNNSLIATLFTFSSPDTIKKALAVVDANPQAHRLLENLVNEQEKIEQKILPREVVIEALPQVVEKKISDEVVIEKLPVAKAEIKEEVAVILSNKEVLEVVEPVVKAEIILEPKLKNDFEIVEELLERKAVIIEREGAPDTLKSEALPEVSEIKISEEVIIDKLPLDVAEIDNKEIAEIILEPQIKDEEELSEKKAAVIELEEIELEFVSNEVLSEVFKKEINDEVVMGKLPLLQVEEEVLNLDEFEIVEPVIKTEILEPKIKDDFEIEKVLSEEQEEDLQDEVEFLEEISPDLNQLVSEFDAIIQPDELLLTEENSVDLPQENEFLEDFIQDLKGSKTIEEDLENEIPSELEETKSLDLDIQIQEFNEEITPQILQKTSDEIEIKTVFQDMVLNSEDLENVMILKSPIPEKELPILKKQDSEIGDEEGENNAALESQRILYDLEESKKKSHKQKDEFELPLPTAQVQAEEFNDIVKPPKADLLTQEKDSKSELQIDEDEIFISQFGTEKSEDFKTAILEIRDILRENEGQEFKEESEFSDDKKLSFDLGEAPSKSPIPVSAIKTSIIAKQAVIAMAA